ncbi:MAG: alpha-E domain-containing protein [Deltaproteobacteria bacterium]|nr:alpha-E domain-containing protein [Deltaproteobacteria bacterium]
MLSRVANAIYWTSRYLERAENVSRMVYVNLHYSLENLSENTGDWFSIIKASGDEDFFLKKYKIHSQENIIKFLITDKKNQNSIFSCVTAARENARTIRDIISSKMWEDINQMYWIVQDFVKKRSALHRPEDFLIRIQECYLAFLGAAESTMNHDEAWHFSRLGRMVERGDKTGRILDVNYFILSSNQKKEESEPAYQALMSKSLLKSASAFEMYRQKYSDITPEKVAHFLSESPVFPRSIYYCTHQITVSINAICTFNNHPSSEQLQEKSDRLLRMVQNKLEKKFSPQMLHQFIDEFQSRLNELDSGIFEIFFSTKIPPDLFQNGSFQKQTSGPCSA